jgi:phenylalanyl-tRNA synthetase alpha subunit
MESIYRKTIEKLKDQLLEDISAAKTLKNVDILNIKYLARQGEINQLFKTLPLKGNPEIGKAIN